MSEGRVKRRRVEDHYKVHAAYLVHLIQHNVGHILPVLNADICREVICAQDAAIQTAVRVLLRGHLAHQPLLQPASGDNGDARVLRVL